MCLLRSTDPGEPWTASALLLHHNIKIPQECCERPLTNIISFQLQDLPWLPMEILNSKNHCNPRIPRTSVISNSRLLERCQAYKWRFCALHISHSLTKTWNRNKVYLRKSIITKHEPSTSWSISWRVNKSPKKKKKNALYTYLHNSKLQKFVKPLTGNELFTHNGDIFTIRTYKNTSHH